MKNIVIKTCGMLLILMGMSGSARAVTYYCETTEPGDSIYSIGIDVMPKGTIFDRNTLVGKAVIKNVKNPQGVERNAQCVNNSSVFGGTPVFYCSFKETADTLYIFAAQDTKQLFGKFIGMKEHSLKCEKLG